MSLPPWLHITLVVMGIAFFIIRFVQLRLYNELVLAAWIGSTLVEFVTDNQEILSNVKTAQIVMFVMFLFLTMNQKPPQNRQSAMQKLSDFASGDLDKTVGEKYQQKEDEALAESEEKRRKISQANAQMEEFKSEDEEDDEDGDGSDGDGGDSGDGGSDGGGDGD